MVKFQLYKPVSSFASTTQAKQVTRSTVLRPGYSNLSEWKAPISPNFQNFVVAPISPNFKMMEAPISPNFQNRRHFDLFFRF